MQQIHTIPICCYTVCFVVATARGFVISRSYGSGIVVPQSDAWIFASKKEYFPLKATSRQTEVVMNSVLNFPANESTISDDIQSIMQK
jgi:hypothetical protein